MAPLRTLSVVAALLAAAAPGAAAAEASGADAPRKTVLVAGATGKTGVLVYKMLRDLGKYEVRGLVRNATKAREVLGCGACTEAEGIFVGDVTNEASLAAPTQGADALMVLTSAFPTCDFTSKPPKCHFPPGATPKEVDWDGARSLVSSFGRQNPKGAVLVCSSMATTSPKAPVFDGDGHLLFYKLNQEAMVMNTGLPWTIVKPCGLSDEAEGQKTLTVGHDDTLDTKTTVSRADVARAMVEALDRAEFGLRFDMCATPGKPAQPTDYGALLAAARVPFWGQSQGQGQGQGQALLQV